MDSVNKYRHGVLVGNFVEDKFGKDLHEKGPNPDAPKTTTTKTHHDLAHSLHTPNPFIAAQQPDRSQFYATARGITGEPVPPFPFSTNGLRTRPHTKSSTSRKWPSRFLSSRITPSAKPNWRLKTASTSRLALHSPTNSRGLRGRTRP